MNNQEAIDKIAEVIKQRFSENSSGHDWWHIKRVYNIANKIGIQENANLEIIKIGALLHDVADYKFGAEETGLIFAENLMNNLCVQQKIISKVKYIIKNIGFKGGNKPKMKILEGKCVQDADRLDAMGAIGIARCFAFGGWKGNPIYDPNVPIKINQTEEQYKQAKSPQINHFYEKLLFLKDKMNTQTGKIIAEKRHKVMKQYLKIFFEEWRGKS